MQCAIADRKRRNSHDQRLRSTHTKNRRFQIEVVTKMNDCFTVSQYKTREPKKIERETGILSLDPKWLPSKFIKKKNWIKNVGINHLSLSESKIEKFQSKEKKSANAYFL